MNNQVSTPHTKPSFPLDKKERESRERKP